MRASSGALYVLVMGSISTHERYGEGPPGMAPSNISHTYPSSVARCVARRRTWLDSQSQSRALLAVYRIDATGAAKGMQQLSACIVRIGMPDYYKVVEAVECPEC